MTSGPDTRLYRLAREGRCRPSLGTFYGPHREEFARVAALAAGITGAAAARLDEHPSGPFVVPGRLDDDTRWALARARDALEVHLLAIAPEALAPDPSLLGYRQITGAPWVYLLWALEAKIVAIGAGDQLDPGRIADLERRWQAIFGGGVVDE